MTTELAFGDLQKSGFIQTPLKKFSGVAEKYEAPKETTKFLDKDGKNKTRIVVKFYFKDLKDIQCHTGMSYNANTAIIEVPYSGYETSYWGILRDSIVKAINRKDIKSFHEVWTDYLQGKRMVWEYTPGHDFGKNKQTGEPIIKDAWELISIEQVSHKSAFDICKELLDGKTEQQFNMAALAASTVQADQATQSAVLDRTFIQSMLKSGLATKDDNGVYHLVKEA